MPRIAGVAPTAEFCGSPRHPARNVISPCPPRQIHFHHRRARCVAHKKRIAKFCWSLIYNLQPIIRLSYPCASLSYVYKYSKEPLTYVNTRLTKERKRERKLQGINCSYEIPAVDNKPFVGGVYAAISDMMS